MKTCMLVTTWNRTPQLTKSLERLFDGTLTLPDEILVIDDGGSDGCDELVKRLYKEVPIPLRYIYTHNPELALCAHARNVGLKHTDADLLILTEPEMYFITDVVKQLVDKWHETSDVVSAGVVYHAQHEQMITPEQANRIEGWVAPYTAIVERAKLLAIGGWTEFEMPGAWGFDDIDLLTRLRVIGIGQTIDRAIEVFHMWHVNPGRDTVGAMANDGWWKTRNYDEAYIADPAAVIANKGREWGVIKPR